MNSGDLFFIDTKLWWHCTSLPPDPLSVSFARDVFTPADFAAKREGESADPEGGEDGGFCYGMTNVDGLYAPHDIGEGDVVFTEEEMPDGAIGRADNPNCEVVEVEDEEGGEGGMAVVAIRDIKEGEFFTVADSDDEDDGEDEEEEEEEEEKEEKEEKEDSE